jgi:hypothetical protein
MEPCRYRRMKMSNLDGKEQDLLVQHVISQFMKDQLNGLKEGKGEADNSFVYLENSTLNMLILYLLMNGKSRTHEKVSEDSQEKNVEELEHIIADSKKDFEEILTLLKEKF